MPFDPTLALQLAKYANDAYYAYRDDDAFLVGYRNFDGSWQQSYSRTQWLADNHYTLIVNPQGATPAAKYWGVVATTTDSVIVSFRGTSTWSDIAIDALGGGSITDSPTRISFPFAEWQIGSSAVWVHKNFSETYQSVKASVRQTVQSLFDANPNLTKLYVTGHSLGGALASICALDIATALCPSDPKVPRPRLYTYASPFVGDQAFATMVNQSMLEAYRINDSSDWVPAVPTRGWTPQWLRWYYGGKVGSEPTKWAQYVHVQAGVAITTRASFPWSHALTNYFRGCAQLKPYVNNPLLRPSDPITRLSVRIKTADAIGSGTDNDVFIDLLGVRWGALDNPGNDFEAGSIGVYDLFAMFPSKVPPSPTCGQLTSVGLHLGDGAFYTSVWTMGWDPEWAAIEVNDIVFTTIYFTGTLGWYTSRDISASIEVK
ncbi:MAG TPA: hypothetical protein VIJ33_09000 [Solirubrobacteraceae bacterium]